VQITKTMRRASRGLQLPQKNRLKNPAKAFTYETLQISVDPGFKTGRFGRTIRILQRDRRQDLKPRRLARTVHI
jgi:hypothetical protein